MMLVKAQKATTLYTIESHILLHKSS